MARVKMIAMLVFIMSLGLVFVACSEQSGGEQVEQEEVEDQSSEVVELNFVNWATAEDATKEKIEKVISAFEDENPNIKIKSVTVPFSEIQNQLTVMTTGGNPPDIAQVDANAGVSLATMGALEPVDNLLSEDFLSELNSSYYDTGLYDGEHYLVPWGGGINGFWYNKTIMEEAGLDPENPPKTMEELESAMEAVKQLPDVIPLQYDTTPRPFSTTFQWSFMVTLDNEPFSRDGSQVNEMTDYAEWLRNLVDKEYTLPGKKLGEFRPLAAQNRLAFAFDAPFFKGTVQSFDEAITDEVFNDTWGVTTLPVGPTGKSYSAIGGSDHFTGVFKASQHKEEAVKFLEFIANSDVALQDYIIPMGYLPVTSSSLERFPELNDDLVTKSFMEEIVPTSVAPPFGEKYAEAASILATNMQEIITTSNPVEEILNKTQIKLESIIEGK